MLWTYALADRVASSAAFPVADPGGGAPLFLDQTKARRTEKNYLETGHPLISGSGSGTDFCLLSWSFLTMLAHSKTAVQNIPNDLIAITTRLKTMKIFIPSHEKRNEV